MNATDILQKVREGADAHFGDTVDKLLLLLRRQHTHQSHKGECHCEYCSFIRTTYTDAKIALHRIKRRFDYYDGFFSPEIDDSIRLTHLQQSCIHHQKHVLEMKAKKFDMWKDVL